MTSPSTSRRGSRSALFALAVIGPALAGCQTAADRTGSLYPAQHRDRHPIVLADKPRVLDVFLEGDGIGSRQQRDVQAFVEEYRRYGNGVFVAQVPTLFGDGARTRRALASLRAAVGGRMATSRYEPLDPAVASPIRLTFKRLQASVATQCGLWPQDLGVDDGVFDMANRQYWNFGCSSQANFAAQIADPVDLVRGRQPSPPDTQKRMHAFDQLRQGQDPTTNYRLEASTTR